MQLTNSQHSFLSKVHFAVVSTIASDGMPHQTVMGYKLNGDQLLLSTPFDSLKHKHLKRDNRISVCVEKGHAYVTLKRAK
jgi:general stress protein 26